MTAGAKATAVSRSPRFSTTARVWVYSGLLAALAGFLFLTRVQGLPIPHERIAVPWWTLAIAFAVAESLLVHVHFGREAQSFSLAEIPLVIGLAFTGPVGLVAGRLLGCAFALIFWRRQTPIKVAFNLSLFALEICVALPLYNLILHGGSRVEPAGWIAAFVATAVAGMLGTVAVVGAIAIHQRAMPPIKFREILLPSVATMSNTSLALLAVTVMHIDPRAFWLLLQVTALLLLAYRAYTILRQKHESLELLHMFTQVVGGALDAGSTTGALLEQVRQLLRADTAQIIMFGELGETPLRMTLSGDATDVVIERLGGLPDELHLQAVETNKPFIARRGVKDERLQSFLAHEGVRDAVLAPMKADDTVGTLMVGNRLGEVNSFSKDDLRLLETIANHASISLANDRLVDRLRREVAEKEHQASHDTLTGLANRTLFNRRVEKAIAAAPINGSLAVMLIDLDRFKEINDTLGHHTGDQLLQEVAARLRQTLDPAVTIARLGGDEFAILIPRVTDAIGAWNLAEDLRHSLELPFVMSTLTLYVGASIGIALHPDHGQTAATLLQRADVAMYAAKAEHKGSEVYAAERDDHSHRRLAMVADLRHAVEHKLLEVHYQPKANLSTGEIVGAEALVRWTHSQLGPVAPDEFIPVAERTGLIRALTLQVLEQSLADCLAWSQATGRPMGVAVNLSAGSLLNLEFPRDVAQLLETAGVAASALTLEITESTIMADPERAITVLNGLAAMGVELAIDDFGTGYSSLSQLKRLPVTELKIDRSFVMNMAFDDNDAVIVHSTIDLGRNLGLRVVAEGVEDGATWDRLSQLGCDVGQGYHLSRPVPAPQLLRWLRDGAVPAGTTAAKTNQSVTV
jgi:diguanylate cyclase (GGDEF)-like protein